MKYSNLSSIWFKAAQECPENAESTKKIRFGKVDFSKGGALEAGVGGGVNPSPEGEEGLLERLVLLNHLSPEGWWD